MRFSAEPAVAGVAGDGKPESATQPTVLARIDLIRLLQVFPKPITRDDLKACTVLKKMMLLQMGSRLSIQPVTVSEWLTVHRLAGVKDIP
jgi:predicted RNA-binding protein with PUA-like domain